VWRSLRRRISVDFHAVLLQLSSEQRVGVLQLLDLGGEKTKKQKGGMTGGTETNEMK